jgi:2-dehydro-3-deoxyphosphooctonate aldolase (KDO 8-P synthase)
MDGNGLKRDPKNIYPFSIEDITGEKLFLIAGPCVVESEKLCMEIAEKVKGLGEKYNATVIFKASYDKANRTSASSFRGLGKEEGLRVLDHIKNQFTLPILTDVHSVQDIPAAADVVDVLQIPAFLCRQTDLLAAAGATGRWVNIKKGQFMAPDDMRFALDKAGKKCLLTERGTFFGYNRLVVDYCGLHIMKNLGVPVVFDATHSVQQPGGGQGCSTGSRALAIPLAMAALCQGINGLFFEIHPDPDRALCDGPNSISVAEFEKFFPRFIEQFQRVKEWR